MVGETKPRGAGQSKGKEGARGYERNALLVTVAMAATMVGGKDGLRSEGQC